MNPEISSSVGDFVRFEKLRDNFEWFYSNYEELKRNFSNQYVAVKNKCQIDHDYDLEILLKRLNLLNCDESIAIEYVHN